MKEVQQIKLGILGAGQLGRMLLQAASPWNLKVFSMDKTETAPASLLSSEYFIGDINDYDSVLEFGRKCDVITIEIEHVNIEALKILEKDGIKVFPSTHSLEIIKDKGLQKQFYKDHEIPTAEFEIFEDKKNLINSFQERPWKFPFVQKSRTGGYDGKGVFVVKSLEDFDDLLDGPCLVEKFVPFEKEIAVVVARNEAGEISVYEPVEMEFHPTANLVEFLFYPTSLPINTNEAAKELAKSIASKIHIVGLLAVEMFYLKDGTLIVNEIAPRPHNSGHHTIDASMTSQFEQHIRAILGLPLGDTSMIYPAAVMINLLGSEGYSGIVSYPDFAKFLGIPGLKFHLYGKEMTSSFRKMGHTTVVSNNLDSAKKTAREVLNSFRIIA
jgi:5-(carboxyamino)imidazole ribonucleotide synthase